MAETAAQRFARDTGYKALTGIADHEDGTARAIRNYKNVPAERSGREYDDGAGNSALETYIGTIQ